MDGAKMGRAVWLATFCALAGCGADVNVDREASGANGAGFPDGASGTSAPDGSTGVGGAGTGATGTGANATGGGLVGTEVIDVGIEAEHVLADPVRGVFYVTVSGAAVQHANSLVVVNADAEVVESVQVGSQPSTMALSDDASTLWVSLVGSLEVRRVDLSSNHPVPGVQHALPPDPFSAVHAGPMVVLPGTTDSLAISLHYQALSPSYAGSIVMDNGVVRPEATPGHTGASLLTGGPEGWLFGFNDKHTGFEFYSLEVGPNGLSPLEFPGLMAGFYTAIAYRDGRVYAGGGEVIDVSVPTAPKKAGQFAYAGPSILPLSDGRAVMLSSESGGPFSLRLLESRGFVQLEAFDLPDVSTAEARELVRVEGGNGAVYAFIGLTYSDDPGQLYMLGDPFSQ